MRIKPLADIQARLQALAFDEDFDLIVAIARGGLIPATMLQARLGVDLEWLWVHFRADDQTPVRPQPTLLRPLTFDPTGRRILVVDDRASSGQTLTFARQCLAGAAVVKTLVVNGRADYSLFNDECFYFPWRMDIPPGTETEGQEAP